MLFLHRVLRGQSLQSVLVYNITNMHEMSFRSDFFACSCGVNIGETTVCFTEMLLLSVFQVGLPSFLIPTTMSDTKSSNISLPKVMISSNTDGVFICDVSDRTIQIIFDASWVSMNVGAKRPIAWNDSRYMPLWRFFLHCGIDETGYPFIICINCHQVLRHPSEHGTSSMAKNLLSKAHLAMLNESTESEVTELASLTVDETSLDILKSQESRGITVGSSQRKIIFDIQVNSY